MHSHNRLCASPLSESNVAVHRLESGAGPHRLCLGRRGRPHTKQADGQLVLRCFPTSILPTLSPSSMCNLPLFPSTELVATHSQPMKVIVLFPLLSRLAFLTWLLHHQPEQTEPTGDNLQLVSLITASDQSSVCASKRKAWLLLAWMVADCCWKCFSSHDDEYFVF
jgi:hypothetical protein